MDKNKTLHLFARISKVDETKHEVWGVATAEMVDKDGEIFDYDSSKPFFKAWSDEISKATDGKSLGNIREMHEPSAVGKLVAISFDDELKQIPVGAKIVDDIAWKKCMEGVYTGFSIGGKYENAWKDGEYVRFTAKPYEISIVDNPCVPGAHFTAVKADGKVEVRKFAAQVKKDLGSVSNLAYVLQSALFIQMDTAYEAEYEADGSKIPAQLKAWVKDGAAILARMTQEELDELVGTMKSVTSKIDKANIEKAGAKHSAATKAHHAAIKESLTKAMGHCDALMEGDKAASVEVTKVPAEVEPKIETQESNMLEKNEMEKLEKANTDSASALSKVTEVEKGVTDLKAEVTKGFGDIGTVLNGLVKAIAGQSGIDVGATVARTEVPAAVTVTKSQENGGGKETETIPDLTPEEIQKLSPADREKRFRAMAKMSLQTPTNDKRMPGFIRN